MWRMQSGDRVLTAAEWDCFRAGLGPLRDGVEDELIHESDPFETDVALFDRLSAEQKLALLAEIAIALSDPEVSVPHLTAINESAIAAVLRAFWDSIGLEMDAQQNSSTAESPRCDNRRLLLAVHADALTPDDLPALTETDEDEWLALFEALEGRILWDRDFQMADDLLDLPPEEMDSSLAFLRIDRDYFRSVAHEPNEAELISARQTLARMIGVAVMDDDGCYPFLEDLYHGLAVGPCPAWELAAWEGVPWIQIGSCTTVNWECSYEIWQAEFSPRIPTQPFTLNPEVPSPSKKLPDGMTIEELDSRWVVRHPDLGYWADILDSGWADVLSSDEPALSFSSPEEAAAAYWQADRMYKTRAMRRQEALKRLGTTEPT